MPTRTFPCSQCGEAVTPKKLGSLAAKTCLKCQDETDRKKFDSKLAEHRVKRKKRKREEKQQQVDTERKEKEEHLKKLDRQREAQKEMARRELARKHIIPFVTRFKPDYKVGWVHKVFAAKLEKFYEDVKAGKQPRLMLFLPPRAGKSEVISNNFPSWILGKEPTWEIIMASHTVDLPVRFSRANRARIKDERYKVLFPETQLDKESTSANEWLTTKRGGLKCAGVGTGISGFGAHVLIIDDPIKDYEDAQSETIRESVKNWYTTVAEARLAPQGGVICVMTRWMDDDLAGWQLRMEKELREQGYSEEHLQHWEAISFPALAESDEYIDRDTYDFFDEPGDNRIMVRPKGEALHPARYDKNFFMRKKIGMPSNQWSALYQQNPVPASGEFFREEDFMYYDQVPVLHDYPVVFSWDLAIGENRNNDYTVGFAGAVIPKDGVNALYVLDMYRNRVRDREQLEAIVNMYAAYKHNATRLGIEQGQIWLAIEKRLKAMFRERGHTPVFDDTLMPVRDKRVRATPLQGWMQNHRVYFPRHQPWVSKAREELLRFDAGVHDDVVDSLAWMVRMVQNMALVPKFEVRRSEKTVKELLADYAREQRQGSTDSTTGYMAS